MSTMAISFITCSYHLFHYFLLSTTLPYSHLHYVQLATATLSLFDVYDHFVDRDLSIDFRLIAGSRHVAVDDVDTMESPLSRRLWDPGIHSTACRFNVDRIDRPPVPLHPSIGSMSPIDLTAQLRWQWDPGKTRCECYGHLHIKI